MNGPTITLPYASSHYSRCHGYIIIHVEVDARGNTNTLREDLGYQNYMKDCPREPAKLGSRQASNQLHFRPLNYLPVLPLFDAFVVVYGETASTLSLPWGPD